MKEPIHQAWLDLLEDINLGIMAFDPGSQQLVYQNRAMQSLIPDLGNDFAQFKKYFSFDPDLIASGRPSQNKLTLTDKTIGYTVYPQANGLHWILASEISEKDRQQQIQATASVMTAIDFTFFSLAHEMGNPINSIKMTLEVLINNFKDYDTKTKLEYLTNLHSEFNRLEELLKAIKSFNMFENLVKKAIAIQVLIDNLLQHMTAELKSKGIDIRLNFPKDPVICQCDPRAFHQVLLNIMTNAIDALQGRKDPFIAIAVAKKMHEAVITIRDNGCGIPEEKMKELFMPFSSNKPRGVGLGLAITKKLLTQMGGTIELSSHHKQGTQVMLRLPLTTNHESR